MNGATLALQTSQGAPACQKYFERSSLQPFLRAIVAIFSMVETAAPTWQAHLAQVSMYAPTFFVSTILLGIWDRLFGP